MQTKDLMTTSVVKVSPSVSVSEVADLLHSRGFSGVPVVNDDNTVLGVITERELFSQDAKLYLPAYVKILQDTHFVIGGRRELPYVAAQLTRTKASDIMNQDMFYARPETELEELAEAFSKYDQNPIPVTDNNNKLLGIVSRTDLVKLLAPAVPTGHSGRLPAMSHENLHRRVIDERLSYVQRDLSSRFAYVARARANIWLTAAVVLFVVGFVLGVIYVADPTIFTEKIQDYRTNLQIP
jgi:CBS domain-containing protein